MSIKMNDAITFEELISLYEENELDLDKVPNCFVKKYGYACLANALMFKEPAIPKYNEKIKDYIQNHTFHKLDSLINYIKNIDNDIDKLFAIFTYAALNIEYDVDLYFSGNHKSITLEDVFKTKKAVCSGYAIFFQGMAEKVNIDVSRIIIKEYSNYAKGYSYDVSNPPRDAKSNHASIYVEIDGVPFLSEPTWAAGYITDSKQFEWNFRPELFLIPFYKTLCDHYPCDKSQQLLPFKLSFNQFLDAIDIDPFKMGIKTESCPFSQINCSTGYIKQTYSCIGPINSLSFKIKEKNGNTFTEISDVGLTSYEVIQAKLPKHPDRCRFITHILFPKVGSFLVEMFINTKIAVEYYVNNSKPCKGSIPLLYNPFYFAHYIAIKPKRILSSVSNGVIVICFAVIKKYSRIKWEIMKLRDSNSYNLEGEIIDMKYSQYIRLEIPSNDEFFENQLCIAFPSNGRYSVSISFITDNQKLNKFVRYFFDVSGVDENNIHESNPIYYISQKRKIASINYFDGDGNEIFLKPCQHSNYVNEREQTMQIKTASPNDTIYFEFKYNGKTVVWPKEDGKDGEYRRIKWTIPEEEGEYYLKGWINHQCCISINYLYANLVFQETSQNEIELLNDLAKRLNEIKINGNISTKQNKDRDKIITNNKVNNIVDNIKSNSNITDNIKSNNNVSDNSKSNNGIVENETDQIVIKKVEPNNSDSINKDIEKLKDKKEKNMENHLNHEIKEPKDVNDNNIDSNEKARKKESKCCLLI